MYALAFISPLANIKVDANHELRRISVETLLYPSAMWVTQRTLSSLEGWKAGRLEGTGS